MNKEDSKKRLGLWVDFIEYEELRRECREYNKENLTDLTINSFVLRLLRERIRK